MSRPAPVMRILALVSIALVAALAAGCGDKKSVYTEGDESTYVTAGGLKYQVQLSRALNPTLSVDADYLRGVAGGTHFPAPNQEWFAVVMRVQNDGTTPRRSTDNFEITDTLGNVYRPVAVATRLNPLAYQARTLGGGDVYPSPDSVPGQVEPRSGAVIIFKFNLSVYQNRPLTLWILGPGGRREASVSLDL